MQRLKSLIAPLLIASASVPVSSCGDAVQTFPAPPADLFRHSAEPAIPAEAAASEKAYEDWNKDHADWGRADAAAMDRACLWFRDAGYVVECGPRP